MAGLIAVSQEFLDGLDLYTYDPASGTFSHGAQTLRVKPHPTKRVWVWTTGSGAAVAPEVREELLSLVFLRADGTLIRASDLKIRQLALDEAGAFAVFAPPPPIPQFVKPRQRRRSRRLRARRSV